MDPKPPEVLYHYCSNETFLSIIKSEQIWLSSLHSSNDTQEGLLIERIVDNLLANADGATEFKKMMFGMYNIAKAGALGFCLSEKDDLLSQWRGYADDGNGVSIGFSTKYLNLKDTEENVPGYTLHKVYYEEIEQSRLLSPFVDSIRQLNCEIESISIEQLLDKTIEELCAYLIARFKIKNRAFSEEQECRLISPYITNTKSGPEYVELRTLRDRLIPYRSYTIEKNYIREIVLGPKNTTREADLKNYLQFQGFSKIDIRPSDASYR